MKFRSNTRIYSSSYETGVQSTLGLTEHTCKIDRDETTGFGPDPGGVGSNRTKPYRLEEIVVKYTNVGENNK